MVSSLRLYRTGDLVRYLDKGLIEFLGRIDNQVKVRGFRVEPAGIEAVLRRQPGVADALVTARRDVTGSLQLVAFVVLGSRNGPLTNLRDAIRDELPDYLVPAEMIAIDAIPLTTGGKVDRQALPSPTNSRVESMPNPSNETEEQLLSLWHEIFPKQTIGVEDDFFALGGHSLLAIRLFARIEQVFGSAPPLTAIFQAPTVRHLARVIQGESPTRSILKIIAINRPSSPLQHFLPG